MANVTHASEEFVRKALEAKQDALTETQLENINKALTDASRFEAAGSVAAEKNRAMTAEESVRLIAQTGYNHSAFHGNPHRTRFEDILDKPDIPAQVTESDVAAWGFFKGTIESIKLGISSFFASKTHSHTKADITDFPEIPEGADVLTLDGTRVIKNGTTEITTYNDLLALVRKGGVVLLDTVAGTIAKEALFHPHMADDTAIRFDATGTLGDKVYTRSFAFTPKSGGGITVSRGNLTEVAKKSDVPYALNNDGTIKDHAVNKMEMNGAFSPSFPSPISGYSREFFVNLSVKTAGTWTMPTGITKLGDELTFQNNKQYLVRFTEVESKLFVVEIKDITAISSIFYLNANGDLCVDSANVNDAGLVVTEEGVKNDDGTLTITL